MEIVEVKTNKSLSETSIELADYVINPYKGCQIGCLYCYSRANKNICKINKEWGEYVYVKKNIADLLEKELINKNNVNRVLIGSTTEALQPIEIKYKLTEKILNILKKNKVPIVLLTKMNTVIDYVELLNYSIKNKVYFTYNDEKVRELFEKRSYSQSSRLQIIEQLNKYNFELIVYISPFFPFITDINKILKELKGRVQKIYIEGYNAKMGNWDDIKLKLDNELIDKYNSIFFNEKNYNEYWNNFITNTNSLNEYYEYKIKYFIYPFDSYY